MAALADGGESCATKALLLFLSHAGADTEAARRLKQRLEAAPDARAAGLRVWLDKDGQDNDGLVPGLTWQAQLEEVIRTRATAFAVYVGSRGVVNWVEAEVRLALSRAMVSAGGFPFLPIIAKDAVGSAALPGFAQQFHAVRDVENNPGEFRKLLAAVLGRGGETGELRAEKEPFFGLRAIDEERSHLFFGRETETEELVQRLHSERLLLVVGDSGSGKSSLVKAGLVPRWRGGALAEIAGRRPDEEIWHVVELRPGRNPLRRLGEAVYKAAGALRRSEDERGTYQRWVVGDNSELRRNGLRCGLSPDRTRTLVVVDQFEELVTLTPKEQRRPFVDLLLSLADPKDDAFSVALTMRRDYYNLLSAPEYRPLYDRLEANERRARYSLGRISDEGLRRIVIEPLRLAGVSEGEREALARAVLQDVGQRAGDLALVQFALTRAWERRAESGGDLLRAYHGVGGVEGALAGEAERVFAQELRGEANAVEVGATLIRLARLEGTAGPTRRMARRREFSDERWALLQTLASKEGNHLVLIGIRQPSGGTAGSEAAGEETAEIAHEALLTRWGRLHAWLNEAPEAKRTLDRLADRAAEWADATGDDKAHLLARADAEREAFKALACTRPQWPSAEERAFVETSVAEHAARLRREAEARERERRLRRHAQVGAVFSIALAVLAGAASLAFYSAQNRASRAQVAALARAADLEAARGDAGTALLMTLEPLVSAERTGAARSATAEAERGAYEALQQQREVAVLRGHELGVQAAAFAPDGRRIATGSDDGTTRLWDGETGRELAQLRGHEGAVYAVAFTPDGRRLATASKDSTARLWDTETRRELAVLRGHGGPISSVAFSPDGHLLATGSNDSTARLWEAQDGGGWRELLVLRGHGREVLSVAFSSDGRRLATGSEDRTARVWDVASGRELAVLEKGHTEGIHAATFSADGRRLATGSSDNTVRFWDLSNYRLVGPPLRGHTSFVLDVAFSPDARRLATSSDDRTVRLWEAEDGDGWREMAVLRGHDAPIPSIAFSPDGRRLATASWDHTARLWDAERWGSFGTWLLGHLGKSVRSIAFSSNGRRLVTGSEDHTARVWDAASGRELAVLRGHAGPVSSVALSSDGRRLATGSDDRTARLWEAEEGDKWREIAVLHGHQQLVHAVAFSPDGRRIATGSWDKTARLWEADGRGEGGWREAAVLSEHDGWVRAVAFSPDGRRIATGSEDGKARLWEAKEAGGWRVAATLTGHTGPVYSLTFSADGRRLATGSYDGTARLWEPEPGGGWREVAALRGDGGWIYSIAFSPDGRRLATGSEDRMARLWEAEEGGGWRLAAALRGHNGAVRTVTFSPDGWRLATGSYDGTARLWRLFRSRGDLVDFAKARLPRCLSPAQRVAYGLVEAGEVNAGDRRQPAPPCW